MQRGYGLRLSCLSWYQGAATAYAARLLEVLNSLVERGSSVLVIEHNTDVIKTADYVIDLGPEGGDAGAISLPRARMRRSQRWSAQ